MAGLRTRLNSLSELLMDVVPLRDHIGDKKSTVALPVDLDLDLPVDLQ